MTGTTPDAVSSPPEARTRTSRGVRFEAEDLSARYEGRTLFEGLDLALVEGETLAVLGPSGSGKSRLLRQLALLDPLQSGRMALDGRTPSELGAAAWRARVVYVAQVPSIGDTTAAEFVVERAAYRAVRELGHELDDPVALATGWGVDESRWQRPWPTLSGGEQQRIALAIALGQRPRVLLLDEPTSALDGAATARVEAALAGHTAVWVTHDEAQAARVAERRLVLSPEVAA